MGRFGIGGNAYADFFLKGRFLSLLRDEQSRSNLFRLTVR